MSDSDDVSKLPSALARIASSAVAPSLQAAGLDPVTAGMVATAVAEAASVGIDSTLYRWNATSAALTAELGRRPTLVERFRDSIPTRKGRTATRAFLNASQTATSDERLADLAGILVGGLSDDSADDELTANLIKLAGELSHFEAVHLWDQALGHWQANHGLRWGLHSRHGFILQSGEHAGTSEFQLERRGIALERLTSLGLLRMTTPKSSTTQQGPFYSPTRLAAELFCMIDAPELPKELIRKAMRSRPP